MIRIIGEQDRNIYHVSCSDWECVVETSDSVGAVIKAFELAFEKYGDDLNLSITVSVVNCSEFHFRETERVEFNVYSVPSILSDIGKFQLAEQLKKIIDNNNG